MARWMMALGCLLVLSQCKVDPISEGSGTDPTDTDTRILRVDVEPNPVVENETTTFKAIISDSLDVSMRFTWFLDAPAQTTDVNTISWDADVDPDTYRFTLQVRRGDNSTTPATHTFNVTVVEQ